MSSGTVVLPSGKATMRATFSRGLGCAKTTVQLARYYNGLGSNERLLVPSTCPAPRSKVVDLYFMEHRAKLIDIAAFLDRFDRADDEGGPEDFRMAAFRQALLVACDGQPQRARRVLSLLSDHTDEPIEKAPLKGAHGACPPEGAG